MSVRALDQLMLAEPPPSALLEQSPLPLRCSRRAAIPSNIVLTDTMGLTQTPGLSGRLGRAATSAMGPIYRGQKDNSAEAALPLP